MLHSDDHESWLDAHASGWKTAEPAELGDAIIEDAAEAEYNQVFEDTTVEHDHSRSQSHANAHAHDGDHEAGDRPFEGDTAPAASGTRTTGEASPNAETQAVLEEARELTRQMMSGDESGQTAEDSSDTDASDADEQTG
jgi:hypothetical protein